MKRLPHDGSEMVSAVLLLPFIVLFFFSLASLSVGAFQRQLVEYGVSHIANTLDLRTAELGQEARNEAVREAILESVPLLERTSARLSVKNARFEVTRSNVNSRLTGGDYGRESVPWIGRTVGHVSSQQVRVTATVSYEVPPLMQTAAWHNGENDVYTVQLDRSFVVARREEVF